MSYRFLVTVVALFVSTFLVGQGNWTLYDTNNSGIAYDQITTIFVAKDNTKWIGTEYGLATFDGTNWEIYRQANSGLPGDAIRSITEGKNGAMWIGTFLDGLAHFDGSNWTIYNLSNSGLADNYIRSLVYDDVLEELWVGTSGGLHKFDGINWTLFDSGNSALLSNNIPALALESGSILWAGTINGGLARVENGSLSVYHKSNSGLLDNTILDIAIDGNQNKLLATPSGGLNLLTPGENWSIFLTVNSGIRSNSISSIGMMEACAFLGTADAGIQLFGFWNAYDSVNSPLPEDVITAMTVEGDSVLWIGTSGSGLVRFATNCMTTSVVDKSSLEKSDLMLFPNPVTDVVTLDCSFVGEINIKIINSIGRTFYQSTKLTDGSLQMNLGNLPTGMYFLEIEANKEKVVKKLVKSRF